METQKRICRLCFKTCENFQAVEANTFDVLYKIQLKINLAISEEPVMCTNCAEMLKNVLDFKAMCAHNYAVSFLHKEENVKLDLNKVYLSKNENGFHIPEDHTVCGFCMGLVKKCSVTSLNYENVNDMLKKCLPELDFSIIDTPIICGPCQESLQNCFHFIKNCLIVEEKIEKYCEVAGVNSEGFIELTDVQDYTSRNTLTSEEFSSTLDIKKEIETFCDAGVNTDDAQQFVSNNMLVCKEEGNAADMINIPETIYVKTDIKVELKYEEFEAMEDQKLINVNESFVEVQDQKLNTVQQFMPELKDRNDLTVEDMEIKTEQNDFDSLQGEDSSSTTYQCDICSYKTKRKDRLPEHMLIHKDPSEIEMYQCDSCDFNTKRKRALRVHMLIHKDPSEVTMHKCDFCAYQTKRKGNLQNHMIKHKLPLYQCEFCSFKAKYKSSLCHHMLTHKNPSNITMYQCNICSYETNNKLYLPRHMLIHKDVSEVTMHKCSFCSFQTRHKSSLQSHLVVHKLPAKKESYQCELCSFKTVYKSALRRHVLIHKDCSEVTMYQCVSCSFRTIHRSSMQRHKMVHKKPSDIKMYQCASCSFTTKYKHKLQTHVLTHKGSSK